MTTTTRSRPTRRSDIDLDPLFKRLHLANARRVWRDLLGRAEQEEWPYAQLLTVLVTEEIAQRQQTRLARLARRAAFPFLKTIDDFDFTYQSTVRLALLGSTLSPDFVTEGRFYSAMHQRYSLSLGAHQPEMESAQTKSGHRFAGPAKGSLRNCGRRRVVTDRRRCRTEPPRLLQARCPG